MTLICGEDEMAITKRFRQMTYDAVKFGRSVYTDPVSSAMHGLNALYESLWSVAAPGASSQSIFGHNHASGTSVAGPGGAGGGGALCRGLVWGADNGDSPLFEFEAASAETSIFLTGSLDKIGRVPISQGLDRNKYLVADVYYSASNSDFDFDIYERSLETRGFAAANNPATNNLPQTYSASEDENKTWSHVRFPLAPGRYLSQWMPVARAKTFDSNNIPILKIYALQVWEIDGVSTTRHGQRIDGLTI